MYAGMQGALHPCAPVASIQLESGSWVLSLVYADNVVLLSWSASGLQLLLNIMADFCLGLDLVKRPPRTKMLVGMAQSQPAFGGSAVRSFHDFPALSTLA